MDGRSFPNPHEDYTEDSNVIKDGKLSPEFSENLISKIYTLLIEMEKGLKNIDERHDYSIYTGATGIALLYLHLHSMWKKEEYLQRASDYISRPLRHLKGHRCTFLCGDAGPLAVGAVIYKRLKKDSETEKCLQKLLKIQKYVLDPSLPDEVLYGRSGYLYALLFVRKHLGESVIPDETLDTVTDVILKSGNGLSEKEKLRTPLMFKWHEKHYVGAAHGISGILFMLLQSNSTPVRQHLEDMIQPTIDYVTDLQFDSGNYPSSLSNTSDRLVHWCHGAPGAVHMLLSAYKAFGDAKYLEAAKRCGDIIWQDGLLKKGYGLCHGAAGNGYSFIHLLHATTDVKYLHRAAKFGEWCLNYGTHGCRTPDRPFSLFEGLAGTIYFMTDLLQPSEAKMPAFYV